MQSSGVKNLTLPHSISVTILLEILFQFFLHWSVRKIIKIHTKESLTLQPAEGTDDVHRHRRVHGNAFPEKFNTLFLFPLAKQLLGSGPYKQKR